LPLALLRTVAAILALQLAREVCRWPTRSPYGPTSGSISPSRELADQTAARMDDTRERPNLTLCPLTARIGLLCDQETRRARAVELSSDYDATGPRSSDWPPLASSTGDGCGAIGRQIPSLAEPGAQEHEDGVRGVAVFRDVEVGAVGHGEAVAGHWGGA
jgi:hypothetical protein